MPINMVGYKMIYKNVVYNVLSINLITRWVDDKTPPVLDLIDATYINEDGRIMLIRDVHTEFQFISK